MTIILVIATITLGLPLSPMLILSVEATTESQRCFGQPATIVGTDYDDVLQDTEGIDYIVGLGGNDRILGYGGNDLLYGSSFAIILEMQYQNNNARPHGDSLTAGMILASVLFIGSILLISHNPIAAYTGIGATFATIAVTLAKRITAY